MLSLRPFRPEDAREIAGWIKSEEALRKWSADTYEHFPITDRDINAFYEKSNQSGKFFPITAVINEEIMGHFIIRLLDDEDSSVRFGFIVLNSERRGQGFGKQMLALAKKYAAENFGAKKIGLVVFKNNPSAYFCYKSVGFCESKVRPAKEYCFSGQNWTCLEMDLEDI